MFKSQKGFAHIFLIILLLAGITSGVYLVQKNQIFKPKAAGEIFNWVIGNDSNSCIRSIDSSNKATAVCQNIQFRLNLPASGQLSNKGSSSLANMSLIKTAYANHEPNTEDWYCKTDGSNTEVWHSKNYKAEDNDNWWENIWHGASTHEKIKTCDTSQNMVCKEFQTPGYKVDADCFPKDQEPAKAPDENKDKDSGSNAGQNADNKPSLLFPLGTPSDRGDGLVHFAWVPVDNAKSYRIFIDNSNTFYNTKNSNYVISISDFSKDKS